MFSMLDDASITLDKSVVDGMGPAQRLGMKKMMIIKKDSEKVVPGGSQDTLADTSAVETADEPTVGVKRERESSSPIIQFTAASSLTDGYLVGTDEGGVYIDISMPQPITHSPTMLPAAHGTTGTKKKRRKPSTATVPTPGMSSAASALQDAQVLLTLAQGVGYAPIATTTVNDAASTPLNVDSTPSPLKTDLQEQESRSPTLSTSASASRPLPVASSSSSSKGRRNSDAHAAAVIDYHQPYDLTTVLANGRPQSLLEASMVAFVKQYGELIESYKRMNDEIDSVVASVCNKEESSCGGDDQHHQHSETNTVSDPVSKDASTVPPSIPLDSTDTVVPTSTETPTSSAPPSIAVPVVPSVTTSTSNTPRHYSASAAAIAAQTAANAANAPLPTTASELFHKSYCEQLCSKFFHNQLLIRVLNKTKTNDIVHHRTKLKGLILARLIREYIKHVVVPNPPSVVTSSSGSTGDSVPSSSSAKPVNGSTTSTGSTAPGPPLYHYTLKDFSTEFEELHSKYQGHIDNAIIPHILILRTAIFTFGYDTKEVPNLAATMLCTPVRGYSTGGNAVKFVELRKELCDKIDGKQRSRGGMTGPVIGIGVSGGTTPSGTISSSSSTTNAPFGSVSGQNNHGGTEGGSSSSEGVDRKDSDHTVPVTVPAVSGEVERYNSHSSDSDLKLVAVKSFSMEDTESVQC